MKEFATFAVSFCGVCVAAGGLYMLLPENKMTKTVKYVIVLVIISAFIGLFSVNFNISIPDRTAETGAYTGYDSEKMITAVFEKALRLKNIEFEKITVFTDKSKEGSIVITKIQIYSRESRERIISAIGNSEDYEVEIIN